MFSCVYSPGTQPCSLEQMLLFALCEFAPGVLKKLYINYFNKLQFCKKEFYLKEERKRTLICSISLE